METVHSNVFWVGGKKRNILYICLENDRYIMLRNLWVFQHFLLLLEVTVTDMFHQ